mmetsp:Transcript_11513/g.23599  ORF Transcript_11513/g.23599 Transcript_11513/m.23599 type:complete len:215 (-) Transcript_11513:678-1322(-)
MVAMLLLPLSFPLFIARAFFAIFESLFQPTLPQSLQESLCLLDFTQACLLPDHGLPHFLLSSLFTTFRSSPLIQNSITPKSLLLVLVSTLEPRNSVVRSISDAYTLTNRILRKCLSFTLCSLNDPSVAAVCSILCPQNVHFILFGDERCGVKGGILQKPIHRCLICYATISVGYLVRPRPSMNSSKGRPRHMGVFKPGNRKVDEICNAARINLR